MQDTVQVMKAKLTTRSVATLKPEAKPYKVWDTELAGFFIKVRPSGTMTYGIWYRVNGKAAEFTLGKHGTLTLAQARGQARRQLGQVANGTDVQAEKVQARRQQEAARFQTWGGFLDHKYGPWARQHRKSASATLARLEACFAGWRDRSLADLTPWLVESWRSKRLKAGTNPATVNRDLVALKAALAKAVDWNIIEQHPLVRLKPLKLDTRGVVRYLSENEEQQLRRALSERETRVRTERLSANQWRQVRGYELLPDLSDVAFVDHLQPIVLVAINTGLRRGELFNLQWPEVNLATRTLTVRGDGAKSGQTRHIPINDETLKVLSCWRAQNEGGGYLFPAENGGRLTSVKRSWGNLLDKAGIDNFRLHDCRHHFASRLVMAGVDLNTVRELLGHSSLDMTLRYAHLAPEHKAAAVALLSR